MVADGGKQDLDAPSRLVTFGGQVSVTDIYHTMPYHTAAIHRVTPAAGAMHTVTKG